MYMATECKIEWLSHKAAKAQNSMAKSVVAGWIGRLVLFERKGRNVHIKALNPDVYVCVQDHKFG